MFCIADPWLYRILVTTVRMQAEATDSSLREGIEALGVKDTDKSAGTAKQNEKTELLDAEMTNVTEDNTAAKDGTSNYRHIYIQIMY